MKRTSFHLCFFTLLLASAANGQSTPAPSPATETTPAAAPLTLSKQIASDCYNKRRLAIRAVNLKYIDLTKAASALFAKESNPARTADAETWIKNLVWANDANFKGIAPETKDRLGELQVAYLKERVNAIVTANTASIEDVEVALKKAAQAGDQAGIVEMTKLEDRIKQELHSIAGGSTPGRGAPAVELTTAGKAAADYYTARTATIKGVNSKYIALAQEATALYAKESNDAKSLEAKDWARRLQWTDGGNLLGMSSDTTDRLGILQTTYLKERAKAVIDLDKLNQDKIDAAAAQATKDNDQKGAEDLTRIAAAMRSEIAGKNPVPVKTTEVAATTQPRPENPAAPAAPQSQNRPSSTNPFGVTEEQFNKSVAAPLPPPPTQIPEP